MARPFLRSPHRSAILRQNWSLNQNDNKCSECMHYRFYSPLQLRKFFKNNIKFFGDKRVTGLSRTRDARGDRFGRSDTGDFREIFAEYSSVVDPQWIIPDLDPTSKLFPDPVSAPKLARVKKRDEIPKFLKCSIHTCYQRWRRSLFSTKMPKMHSLWCVKFGSGQPRKFWDP